MIVDTSQKFYHEVQTNLNRSTLKELSVEKCKVLIAITKISLMDVKCQTLQN